MKKLCLNSAEEMTSPDVDTLSSHLRGQVDIVIPSLYEYVYLKVCFYCVFTTLKELKHQIQESETVVTVKLWSLNDFLNTEHMNPP